MIFTHSREYKSITDKLTKDNIITIVSCNNCVRVCGTGGAEVMKELALRLREDGYNVKDGFLVTKACPQPYMGMLQLSPLVDTVIVLACTAGWSTASRVFKNRKVIRTLKDVGLLITDTDKGVVKIAKAFDGYEDQVGKEFEIGTGAPMTTQQMDVEV